MSPATPQHEDDSTYLASLLRAFVDAKGLGRVFGSNLQLRLESGRRRVPDLTFVSSENESYIRATYYEGAPDLVVEFVSEESSERDWEAKYIQYEMAGIAEYWVIDRARRRMEIFVLDEDGHYQPVASKDGKLHSIVVPGFWVRPEWFWELHRPPVLDVLKEYGLI